MHYIQVNVGRNVGTVPMSDIRWSEFRQEVREQLAKFLAAIYGESQAYPYLSHVEEHLGTGTWDGISEDSSHLSILVDVPRFEGPDIAALVTGLRQNLRYIGEMFQQDEVGFISGTRNIKCRTRV